jgi:hypothetical protein
MSNNNFLLLKCEDEKEVVDIRTNNVIKIIKLGDFEWHKI